MADARDGRDVDDQSPLDDRKPDRGERLQRVEASARRALEILGVHLDDLRRRQAELREQAGEAGRKLDALTRTEREYRTEMDDAERRLSRMAVEAAELRVRFEAVAERLRRDADATEAEAMAAPRPDIESDDLTGVLAELKRMGPINPLAAEEYAELSERHAFLSAQLEDLEGSRSELRRIIEALDIEIHNQFLEAYTEIAAAYEENFAVLFPGGRGKLSLTDPDDPMTSGVEIGAQPVGKRVAKMSLLSGGERSLAALAFLFAVFKARPSPFYILDEVEAALDDANLRRFLRLLASFRDNAQLMIVTHQQQTMESGGRADRLRFGDSRAGYSWCNVAHMRPHTDRSRTWTPTHRSPPGPISAATCGHISPARKLPSTTSSSTWRSTCLVTPEQMPRPQRGVSTARSASPPPTPTSGPEHDSFGDHR